MKLDAILAKHYGVTLPVQEVVRSEDDALIKKAIAHLSGWVITTFFVQKAIPKGLTDVVMGDPGLKFRPDASIGSGAYRSQNYPTVIIKKGIVYLDKSLSTPEGIAGYAIYLDKIFFVKPDSVPAAFGEKLVKPSVLFKLSRWVKKIPNNSWSYSDFGLSRQITGKQAYRLIKAFNMKKNSSGNFMHLNSIFITAGYELAPDPEKATTSLIISLDTWRDLVAGDEELLKKTVYKMEDVIQHAPDSVPAAFGEALGMAGFRSKIAKLDSRWKLHSVESKFQADCTIDTTKALAMAVVREYHLEDNAKGFGASDKSPKLYSNAASLVSVLTSDELKVYSVRVKILQKNYEVTYNEMINVMGVLSPKPDSVPAAFGEAKTGVWPSGIDGWQKSSRGSKCNERSLHTEFGEKLVKNLNLREATGYDRTFRNNALGAAHTVEVQFYSDHGQDWAMVRIFYGSLSEEAIRYIVGEVIKTTKKPQDSVPAAFGESAYVFGKWMEEAPGDWANIYLRQDDIRLLLRKKILFVHNSGQRCMWQYPRGSNFKSSGYITQSKPEIIWKIESNDPEYRKKLSGFLNPDSVPAAFGEAHTVKNVENAWTGETILKMKVFTLKDVDIKFGDMLLSKGTGWKSGNLQNGKVNPDSVHNDEMFLRLYRTPSRMTELGKIRVPSCMIQVDSMEKVKKLDRMYSNYLQTRDDSVPAAFGESTKWSDEPTGSYGWVVKAHVDDYYRAEATVFNEEIVDWVIRQYKLEKKMEAGKEVWYNFNKSVVITPPRDPEGRQGYTIRIDSKKLQKIMDKQLDGTRLVNHPWKQAKPDSVPAAFGEALTGYMGWENVSFFKGVYRAQTWIYNLKIIDSLKQHFHLAEVDNAGSKSLEYFKGDLTIYIPKVFGKGTGYNLLVRSKERQKEVDVWVKSAGLINHGWYAPDSVPAAFGEAIDEKAKDKIQARIKDMPDWSVSDNYVYFKHISAPSLERIIKALKMRPEASDPNNWYVNEPCIIQYTKSKDTLFLDFSMINQTNMLKLVNRIIAAAAAPDSVPAAFGEEAKKKALNWIRYQDEYEAQVPEAFARWYIAKHNCKVFKETKWINYYKGDKLNLVTVKEPIHNNDTWSIAVLDNRVKIQLSMEWAADEWIPKPDSVPAAFGEGRPSSLPVEIISALNGRKGWEKSKYSISYPKLTLEVAQAIAKELNIEPESGGGWYTDKPAPVMIVKEVNEYRLILTCAGQNPQALVRFMNNVEKIVRKFADSVPAAFGEEAQGFSRISFLPGMRKKVVEKKQPPSVRFR